MYANVIVDISHEKLDKTFQYSIPDELLCDIRPGVCVDIPFGSRTITGYVIEVTDKPEYDPARTKPLIGVKADSVAVEAKLIALAFCFFASQSASCALAFTLSIFSAILRLTCSLACFFTGITVLSA